MKSNISRLLALLLAFGLIAAACGSSDESETEEETSTESSDDETTDDSSDDETTDEDEAMADDEAGADGEDAPAGDAVEVTILGTLKAEIEEPFGEAVEAYNTSQNTYQLTSVPLPPGGAFLETATGMYASGNAPTIMVMSQEIPEFEDRLLDLSDIDAVKAALPGTLDQATLADGRIIGAPQTIEAYGLLYNQAVLDEAVGGTFDPSTIQTRSQLVELMEQIEKLESTEAAIQLSPMDWSLGAHLTNMVYSPQSADRAERLAYIEDLKSGSANFADNDVFNGWLDTVDKLLEYNQLKDSPLDSDYDPAVAALSSGEVGLWFMGNWAVPNLLEAAPDTGFGIMPLPISDDAADYGNTQVSVGVPAYMVVDAEQSSPEQQAGAIDFLNWLTTTDEGKAFYTDEFKFLPAYADMSSPTDSMNVQIVEYAESGETLEWMNSLYPADGWPTFGATMQKYISGNTDRAGVAEEFGDYWTGLE